MVIRTSKRKIVGQTLREYLDEKCQSHPQSFTKKLKKGDLVTKLIGGGITYEIDDPDIHLRSNLPLNEAHNSLKDAYSKGALDTFLSNRFHRNTRVTIPFSKVYETGEVECLEKAILYQLATQNKTKTYLVNGFLTKENFVIDAGWIPFHSWNIQFEKEFPYLIDPTNLNSEGNLFKVPIINLSPAGLITLNPRTSEKRSYLLVGI